MALLSPSSAQASGSAMQCPAYTEPRIIIRPAFPAYRVNDTNSIHTLRAMSDKPSVISPGVKEMPVGLTASTLKLVSSFEILMTTITPARNTALKPVYCAQIGTLTLDVGFRDITVYLARELGDDRCARAAVMEHELRHVAADKKALQAFLPRLTPFMEKAVRGLGLIRTNSRSHAQDYLRQKIDNALSESTDTLTAERNEAQLPIDTPREYKRLGGVCGGALEKLVRQYQ